MASITFLQLSKTGLIILNTLTILNTPITLTIPNTPIGRAKAPFLKKIQS